MIIPTIKSQPTNINLLLDDGNTSKFPVAEIYNAANVLLTSLTLAHTSLGRYTNTHTFTAIGDYYAIFLIYNDSSHTILSAEYTREIDQFQVSDPVASQILDELLAGHFISDSVGEALTLIRGLVQQNYVVDKTVFNSDGLMTSARFRLFPTGASTIASTDGGTGEGEIASYTVIATAEPSSNSLLKMYKVLRN